ncbi:MAG: NAD(P)/FAD-dependent oxidoreductase, partial [Limisphaerales bacterium]
MSRPLTIIGGGLAGLTLGVGLRKQDVPVAIYESGDYPRHRVCGEFISGRGQAVLERAGLLADFEKAGAVYARSALFVSGATKSPVRPLATPALCLSRYKMDALLAEKFRELGGDLRARSRWNGNRDPEGTVFATGRRLEPAENEIRWFGVKGHVVRSNAVRLEADLEMHISPDGYVGINRVNDGRINVCGLFRARPGRWRPDSKTEWLLGRPESLLRERLENAPFDTDSFCSIAGLQLKPRLAA